MWGFFGLAVGLSVAAAVYMSDRRDQPDVPIATPPPAATQSTETEPAPAQRNYDDNGEFEDSDTTPKASRFDFYTILAEAEMLVTDVDPDIAADTEPVAVIEPGRYILQAGSFSTYEDADRRRAELAMNGIESRIQRVTIDDSTYHRVRIGPISDLDELNMLRSRLRAANIDVLRIRFDE
jgi:cell division protein FtsN